MTYAWGNILQRDKFISVVRNKYVSTKNSTEFTFEPSILLLTGYCAIKIQFNLHFLYLLNKFVYTRE